MDYHIFQSSLSALCVGFQLGRELFRPAWLSAPEPEWERIFLEPYSSSAQMRLSFFHVQKYITIS
jgi:hypothetical protein